MPLRVVAFIRAEKSFDYPNEVDEALVLLFLNFISKGETPGIYKYML